MRNRARRIVDSAPFEHAIPAAIVLCSITVGLEQSSALREDFAAVFAVLDWFFALFFIGEMLLRLIAHRPREFFGLVRRRQPDFECPRLSLHRLEIDHQAFWNVFDLIIVAVSSLSLVLRFFPYTDFLYTARLLRATRVLRLLGMTKHLRSIEEHIAAMIPTVFSFILLLSILLYGYAVMGGCLFAEVAGGGFSSFSDSFMTMFQVMTLDSWAQVMHAVGAAHPFLAAVFFGSFISLTAIITLNVFIAVLTNELHVTLQAKELLRARQLDASLEALDGQIVEQMADLQDRMNALGELIRLREEARPD